MTCDDVVVALSGGALVEEAKAHLEGCAACREAARVLALAALPALDAEEQQALSGLAVSTSAGWMARRKRAGAWRQVASLAVAAGVGALVASAVLLRAREEERSNAPQGPVASGREAVTTVDLSFDLEGANLSSDEVFLDVSWPTPTAGEL